MSATGAITSKGRLLTLLFTGYGQIPTSFPSPNRFFNNLTLSISTSCECKAMPGNGLPFVMRGIRTRGLGPAKRRWRYWTWNCSLSLMLPRCVARCASHSMSSGLTSPMAICLHSHFHTTQHDTPRYYHGGPPYLESPRIGDPRCAKPARIWCRRPPPMSCTRNRQACTSLVSTLLHGCVSGSCP